MERKFPMLKSIIILTVSYFSAKSKVLFEVLLQITSLFSRIRRNIKAQIFYIFSKGLLEKDDFDQKIAQLFKKIKKITVLLIYTVPL